jgi:hypothetical protein
MRAKQAPIHTSQSVAAAVVWTAVCAIFLAFHLIAFPMKTAWGKQHIPVLLYESHVISKDQVDGINDMMGDAFIPTVGALEGAIRSHVKGDQPILFVSGPGNPAGLDMLKYQLYPLRTSFLNAPVSQAVKDKYACRVEWLSNVDVTLMCPDLIWTNKAMVAGTQ